MMSDEMIERLRLIIADSRDGFSTMRKDFAEELKLELEIERGIRAALNAAQQRAEQAERERDEARAAIDRAVEILVTPFGLGEEDDTEQLLSEHKMVNDLLTTFRKPYYTAPQAQPAPTVKADDGELSMQQLIDRAFLLLLEADDSWLGFDVRITRLHSAARNLLDVVERLVKDGAK